jgi:hypothetical protein
LGDGDATNDETCRHLFGTVGMRDETNNPILLSQNRPNPFADITTIEYSVPRSGQILFEILNLYGQPVYREEKNVTSGSHQFDLDMSNLPAGVYTYGIQYEGYRMTKQMVIVR